MSKISFLSDQVINQIAAGEVIENPASAIKELVENSIDAHATRIFVSIKAGGKQSICVEDNGDGMEKEDLLLSIGRHATSKIQKFDDLQTVETFGFRGEALASIAAIAKVKIESAKTEEASVLVVEGGKILSIEPSARQKGTTIEIGSLFYNVPVRQEFQKSVSACTGEVIRTMTKQALAYPEIEFKLTSQEEVVFHTRAEETSFFPSLERRIKDLLKEEFFSQSKKLSFQEKECRFYGYLGEGEIAKKNRIGQYLFVNRRAVVSPAISHCIKQAYGTRLQTGFFPAFVIHMEIPFFLVDVNVHPQKKEVRFKEEKSLLQGIYQAVKNSLEKPLSLTASFSFSEAESNGFSNKDLSNKDLSNKNFSDNGLLNKDLSNKTLLNDGFSDNGFSSFEKPFETEAEKPTDDEKPREDIKQGDYEKLRGYENSIDERKEKAFGLFHKFSGSEFYQQKDLLQSVHFSPQKEEVEVIFLLGNYLLVEGKIFQRPASLVLIDLQRVCARILFEKFLQKEKTTKNLQTLAIPLVFDLSYEEIALVETHKDDLLQMGIECRILGEKTMAIDALLEEINGEDFFLIFQKILGDLATFGKSSHSQVEKEKKWAQAASTFAKKGKRVFHRFEAKKLVEEFFTCQDLMRDPLGQKIWVCFEEKDFAEFFR